MVYIFIYDISYLVVTHYLNLSLSRLKRWSNVQIRLKKTQRR
uniref:Uncharacterized protein n=1 Tax=Lepeophtheirus salmonis TaxID=72036 RepID=A0A0K2UHZ3_LEPSM